MAPGARALTLAMTLAPLLSGCPLNDDYYLAAAAGTSGSGASEAGRGGSSSRGGVAGHGGSGAKSGKGGTSGAAGREPATGGQAGCSDECAENCTLARFRARDYAFCRSEATYAQAQAACAQIEMVLARIEDEGEDKWLFQTMIANYQGAQTRAFVGASDAATEGEWLWEGGVPFWRGGDDGQTISDRYEHWDNEQPADYSPVTMTSEDCLTINFSDGSWNDVRCELPLPFVCEQL